VRPWDGDREPGADLEAVARLVHGGRLADLAFATPAVGAAAPTG
jgi:hypothetical protein